MIKNNFKYLRQALKIVSGQVTMETAAAVIAVFVFFLGVLQIFNWFSSVLVQRQQYYQESRAGAASLPVVGEFTWAPPALNIFGSIGSGSADASCERCEPVYNNTCLPFAMQSGCLTPECAIGICRTCMSSAGCASCASLCGA